jgi:hypothetical protein
MYSILHDTQGLNHLIEQKKIRGKNADMLSTYNGLYIIHWINIHTRGIKNTSSVYITYERDVYKVEKVFIVLHTREKTAIYPGYIKYTKYIKTNII